MVFRASGCKAGAGATHESRLNIWWHLPFDWQLPVARTESEFGKAQLIIWRRNEAHHHQGKRYLNTTNCSIPTPALESLYSSTMATLDSDQVRSLDQTRQLLLSLHTSLVALRSDISQNPQLPSWYVYHPH